MASLSSTAPRIAVLLPAHNAACTLEAALESLRAQTCGAIRVIVIDDGSTDATPDLLRATRIAWRHGPPLTAIRLETRAGIAGALAAAAAAAGEVEFLARQDADDTSRPQRLARQLQYLDEHPDVGLVATGIETVAPAGSTDGWRRYEAWLSACVTPTEIARGLWIESPLPHPTVMMRRTAYDAAGGYRERGWPEDYDLWLRMLRRGIPMAKLPEILYDWTDHPGRASRSLPAYAPEAFLACKAHHLARHLGGRPVIVWGAGRDGRRASRAFLREGITLRAFLDIDPRKIGRTARGVPIHDAEIWMQEEAARGPREDRPMVVAAVGTAGARALIRARLTAAGLEEGADFLCVA